MGNNVLPARAGEVLRVVLLAPRCDASKRTVAGSIVAERLLDVIALAVIFVVVVYGVLSATVLPTDRPLLMAAILVVTVLACALVIWILRSHHVFERVRDWLRPLADSPRALLSRAGVVLLVATFVLWAFEAGVYLAVARSVDLDISVTGALYLVALTNFVAALPAAPGSIGTFDAAVAFGAGASARAARPPCRTCSCCASCSTCRSPWSASSCWSRATAAGRACARPCGGEDGPTRSRASALPGKPRGQGRPPPQPQPSGAEAPTV